MKMIACAGLCLFLAAESSARLLADVFVSYDPQLLGTATHAFRIYALSFIVAGFNIYASAFFTALNNGVVSAIISVSRLFVFKCLSILILPIFWGVTGVWCASIVAESLALLVSLYYFNSLKEKYKYI